MICIFAGTLLTMLVGGMRADDLKALIPLSPAWMIPEGAREGNLLGKSFDPAHVPAFLETEDGLRLNGNYVLLAQTIHVEDEIRRFRGPVFIVQGGKDEVVPLEYAQKAEKLYANAKLVVVPEDTHCFNHYPEIMTAAIKEFLRSLK